MPETKPRPAYERAASEALTIATIGLVRAVADISVSIQDYANLRASLIDALTAYVRARAEDENRSPAAVRELAGEWLGAILDRVIEGLNEYQHRVVSLVFEEVAAKFESVV